MGQARIALIIKCAGGSSTVAPQPDFSDYAAPKSVLDVEVGDLSGEPSCFCFSYAFLHWEEQCWCDPVARSSTGSWICRPSRSLWFS